MTMNYMILTHPKKKKKKLHDSRLFPTLYNAREQLNYKITSLPAATLYQTTTFTNTSKRRPSSRTNGYKSSILGRLKSCWSVNAHHTAKT